MVMAAAAAANAAAAAAAAKMTGAVGLSCSTATTLVPPWQCADGASHLLLLPLLLLDPARPPPPRVVAVVHCCTEPQWPSPRPHRRLPPVVCRCCSLYPSTPAVSPSSSSSAPPPRPRLPHVLLLTRLPSSSARDLLSPCLVPSPRTSPLPPAPPAPPPPLLHLLPLLLLRSCRCRRTSRARGRRRGRSTRRRTRRIGECRRFGRTERHRISTDTLQAERVELRWQLRHALHLARVHTEQTAGADARRGRVQLLKMDSGAGGQLTEVNRGAQMSAAVYHQLRSVSLHAEVLGVRDECKQPYLQRHHHPRDDAIAQMAPVDAVHRARPQ